MIPKLVDTEKWRIEQAIADRISIRSEPIPQSIFPGEFGDVVVFKDSGTWYLAVCVEKDYWVRTQLSSW